MEMANTLAYNDTATITAVKCLIVQAPRLDHQTEKIEFRKIIFETKF